jgi:hypothetical protein
LAERILEEMTMTRPSERFWSRLFFVAALFNFAIGVPLMLARHWAFNLAFVSDITATPGVGPDLWADFGYCVALIGVGYLIVAFKPMQNRAIVWLGILAKGFDVVVLTWRTVIGMTQPIVLLPAGIDGLFILAFIWFLAATKSEAA